MSAGEPGAWGVDRLVLLAPIEPATTGNGLAMRAELFRCAAAVELDVETVVVPVAGRLVAADSRVTIVAVDAERARSGALALAADPAWSDRLALASPLPLPARLASPGLVDEVACAVDSSGTVAVHVVRAYMAPLGIALGERLGARWTTLDLDDDDAAFASAFGDLDAARAYERLLGVFGPEFHGLCAASADEAVSIGRRHRLAVDSLPNAVRVRGLPASRPVRAVSRETSLLFVSNLTYQPNVEAAEQLVGTILPALRDRLAGRVSVTLVGPHAGRLEHLRADDVEVTGFVPSLESFYASATVVVAPIRHGAGTRIKLLEAFAYGVPVVASSAAANGLEVVDGRHLLLADNCDEAVAAIEAILAEEGLAPRLIDEAGRLVRARYSFEVVAPAVRDFFARADARARSGQRATID